MNTRKQLTVLVALLGVYALLVAVTYLFLPLEQFSLTPGAPSPEINIPRWQLALANVGIVVILYGILGVAGFWFFRRLGLPGVFREAAGWRHWLLWPMLLGLALGVLLVVGDRLFALAEGWEGFPHPSFPFSLIASASAGIGEEILFRWFVMGLWAFLLSLIVRRQAARGAVLWIANLIAALAFGAGHLPSAMAIFAVSDPAQIPPMVVAEIFVLNGLMGLVAGERAMRDGLVAAMGIHFWADVVWHVVWPLLGLG